MSTNKHTAGKFLSDNPVYLDCNATTPLDPEVKSVLLHYLEEDYGNEGSRTHVYGARAKQAVQHARDQVAAVVRARRDEVIFTSGATESNNLAIMGLAAYGKAENKTHIISTAIEHKAVLEPIQALSKQGFSITLLQVNQSGSVDPDDLAKALQPNTLLVSIMAANNETGIRQPIPEICDLMMSHEAFLHTDAAQAFGKDLDPLRHERINLISVSGHKLYAPKGIGALIARKRSYISPPIQALVLGGGQERGLRPGTLPVALIASLGMAAETALRNRELRLNRIIDIKNKLLDAFTPLGPVIIGDASRRMDHVINLRIPGVNSESLMLWLKNDIAISNGSACTSSNYEPSHVLKAMGINDVEANECIRISWCHMTPEVDWQILLEKVRTLM